MKKLAQTLRVWPLLPTGSGWVWLAAVLALLATAINYGHNGVFALAFMMLALWLQSAWECRANLSGLAFHWQSPRPVFANEAAQLAGRLENPSLRPRLAVRLALPMQPGAALDIAGQGDAAPTLALTPSRRGWVLCREAMLETRFPLGLWRARRRLPPVELLAYPAPGGDVPLPIATHAGAHRRLAACDFNGVRAYQPGDRLGRINWRVYGRREELAVNVFDGDAGGQTVWLDEAVCQGGQEQRLAQLSAWVLAADRAGLEYGLVLGGRRVMPARGQARRAACLEALALFDMKHEITGEQA